MKVAEGKEALPEAAEKAPKALLASRTNTLFSIPMLLFMGGASHFPLGLNPEYNGWTLFIVLAFIIGLLEVNAIIGKTGVMTSVKGVIHWGFVLAVVLFGIIGIITS